MTLIVILTLLVLPSADLSNDFIYFLGSHKEVLIEFGLSYWKNCMYVTGKRHVAASLPFKYGDTAMDNGVR